MVRQHIIMLRRVCTWTSRSFDFRLRDGVPRGAGNESVGKGGAMSTPWDNA